MKDSPNTREELRNIVTRNGKSGRIPEILEAELDDLEAFVNDRVAEARLDEAAGVTILPDGTLWSLHGEGSTLEERIRELRTKEEESK